MKFKIKASWAAGLILAVGALGAQAQTAIDDLAKYQGPDREARLLEAAKKENGITVYLSYPPTARVLTAFSEKYGIKSRPWRAGSEALLQRVITEAQGNHHDVDFVQSSAVELEALHREGLLQPVRSPLQANLIPAATPAHHESVSITLDVFVAAYNTNLIKKEDLPKSYEDLQDPKWKGKLGVEANDHVWFGSLLEALGEEHGRKVFENIVSTNGMSVRKGHTLLGNLVASGEVPMGLSAYSWTPEQLKKKGAPTDVHAIPPLFSVAESVAVMKKAPNPATALLFYDFIISEEGQTVLRDLESITVHKNQPHPLRNDQLRQIDPARALDKGEAWRKEFEDLIVKRAK
jgi:iron(III) transport system substrate-binding protein